MSRDAFVIISPVYLPHMGGVERYSWNLAGELRKRGYSVYIITSSMAGEAKRSFDDRGIIILRFPSIWPIPDRMPVLLPSGSWKELKNLLRQHDHVRLIAQTNLYLLSLRGVLFAKRNHIDSLMIIHGSNYVCLGNGIIERLEHLYEQWIVKRAKKSHASFTAVSEASASFAGKLGCKVKAITYNAIRCTEIDKIQICNQKTIKKKYHFSDMTTVFTFAGRMIREKGVLQLAEAFKQLANERKDAALIMIGDGPLFHNLESQGIKNIVLTGQLPHDEVIRYLKQSDCFILPSDSDGFPTTILEAAACDCFVIAAPYGGQKEAVQIVNGYLMKDNSSQSIYQAVLWYLHNPEKPSTRIQEGKKKMKAVINWENTTDMIVKAFDNT